ncbi:MAG: Ig-like domain-containing protein [Sporichthyaceae bacterium]
MRNRPRVAVLATAALFVLSGMSACGMDSSSASPPGAQAKETAAASGPGAIAVVPAPGAKNVATDTKVTVRAQNAKLTEVRVVDDDNRDMGGTLSPDGVLWEAEAPVRVGTTYRIEAYAEGVDGRQVEQSGTFQTKDVDRTDTLEIEQVLPKNGAKVGVAHPLVVAFNQPVANRKTVQSALRVTTTPKVEGAWYWIDDTHVHYRPEEFWPADTTVKLQARLAERNAGDGVLGGRNKTSEFTVGRNQVLEVDTKTKRLNVVRDGREVKKFEVSTGKEGWETRNGVKIVMDRVGQKTWTNEAIDAPEDYEERSDYAIRLTNSGEFVHDAPWNEANIGETNASHGCIGLRTEDMRWIWKNSLLGDPIVVTGSPRPYEDLTNRYADWNVSWEKWKKGNAT